MLRFEEVVHECLGNEEFVREFDRFAGTHIGGKPRDPMMILVDRATGFDELKTTNDYKKFVAFVYETVWTRLPNDAKDLSEIVHPPAGNSFQELMENDP